MKYPDHFSTRSNYVCHLFGYPNELHMYRQALIQIKIHRHVFKGYMCQKRADRPSFKFKSRFTGLSINNLFHHPHFISTINSNFHSSTGFAALDVVGNARIISRISGLVRKSGAHAAVIRPQNSSDIPAGRCGLSPSITFSITITSCVTSENGGFPVCTFDKSVVLSFGLGRDFTHLQTDTRISVYITRPCSRKSHAAEGRWLKQLGRPPANAPRVVRAGCEEACS